MTVTELLACSSCGAGWDAGHQCPSRWDRADVTSNRHGGDPYSQAAHASVRSSKAVQRARIKAYIAGQAHGATCEEVEIALGIAHQACSARISELRADHELVENGRRTTRSGRSARVHVVDPWGT